MSICDILVIDDEQVIIDSITKLCSFEGWKVDAVLDARKGLGLLLEKDYRIVICDIMMPEMDGFQFLDELLKRKISTPVIITTGYSTVENAVKSLNSGAIDFLAKPFSFDELISILKRGLRIAEIRQAQINDKDQGVVHFVPCPSNYSHLGYASWVSPENDGTIKIGATDLYLRALLQPLKIELLFKDEEIVQGNPCAQISTGDDLKHSLLAPLTGRILERNDVLHTQPELLEKDPFFKGWIYRILPSNPEYEMKHLMTCNIDQT